MANYRKIKGELVNGRLKVDRPITEFVPSFVDFACEDMEKRDKVEIKEVQFENRIYKRENLKGKYDWEDVEHESIR